MRRVFARLLVALLVPVVIFSNPVTAEAAEGDWAAVQWHMGIGVQDLDVVSLNCGANFGMGASQGGSTLYQRDGYCKGGADLTPGVCQLGEASCTSVRVHVTGPGCSGAMTPADYEGPEDGWGSTDMRWDMTTQAVGACDPTEACIEVTSSTMLGGTTKTACTPIDLDPPDSSVDLTGCPDGKPSASPAYTLTTSGTTEDLQYHVDMDLPANTWVGAALWYRAAPGAGLGVLTPAGKQGGPGTNVRFSWYAYGDLGPDVKVVGIQIIIAGPTPSGWTHAPLWTNKTLRTGLSDLHMGGVHWPARCAFYFGEKIASTANDDYDEPVGEVGAPLGGGSPTPGGTPEPVVDEETPDTETGLLDWLAGLLRSLIGAVKALGSAIAAIPQAILDGLTGLFVPENAPDFGDVPSPLPEGWVPSMPSLGGAGCGALTFPRVELGFNDMTAGPVDFANTCAAPWPTVRLFTYNGTLVLVLVSAVWMGFRAIASGLGVGVAMGSGGRDDD